ncbi:MAG: amidohydrolase family protein [Chloroflexi bacterium]|nr:amidohydrolase family protein [Chloroflexota bacterium]
MGIAKGRFTIDTHVHAQRAAIKWQERGLQPDWVALGKLRAESTPYDNSPRLLYDMERYNVDMCVLNPYLDPDIDVKLLKQYPDKFVGMYGGAYYSQKVRRGEVKWSIEGLCQDLDEQLSTGLYVAIGESMPGGRPNQDQNKLVDWEQRFADICQIMEVAKKHKVTVGWHTGGASGYAGGRRQLGSRAFGEGGNPLLAHDVAAAFPDVPLILTHGGIDGWWRERTWELCLEVAAAHPNVYLETGQWWTELYEKPLRDPNIGVERLIWGTDWGAAHPIQWWPGAYPSVYFDQNRKEGIPAHQVDIFGQSLRWLDRLDITQDDLNLILGGNAVRLFKLESKVPHTRFFKQFLK